MSDESDSARPKLEIALQELTQLTENKELNALLDLLKREEDATINTALDMNLTGLEDIFIREQLFGEIRGLRRMKAEFNIRIKEVKKKLKNDDAEHRESNTDDDSTKYVT